MSILGTYNSSTGEHSSLLLDYKKENGQESILNLKSNYQPTKDEKECRQMIINHFRLSDVIMKKPRREWNDLSTLSRMMVDQMAFNAYQPNNGDALEGDDTNAWRSRAMRPIVRNKIMSIAAHVTANLIFPKVFAYNNESTEDKGASEIMADLMEWSADQSGYVKTNLFAVIASLFNPCSFIYTEYGNVYDQYKTDKEEGKWKWETRLNEELSGFNDECVPCDEIYIADFYTHDIQKQDYLIRRKVNTYNSMYAKYKNFPNFKYVKPGVQVIYNDANQTFYETYDSTMRQEMCEEIIYWNKIKDLKIISINGILLTDWDNPNPRQDKKYPFIKFGYELMDEGKCFYYKSLAFKMMQDANIVNTLYPMIIDGTYLSLMPPMMNTGSQKISSDVIVPGAVTTVNDPGAVITPIQVGQNLTAGLNALQQVEESIAETSTETPTQPNRQQTAYELSIRQKEAVTLLGTFVQMIMQYVKDFGELRVGDIIQYLTVGEISELEGDLVYKSFLLFDKKGSTGFKTKKIQFNPDLPNKPLTKKKELEMSFDILKEQGGEDSTMTLHKVNPELFRNLKYKIHIQPDIMTPLTEEAERAFGLELYDRAIQNQSLDQEQITRDFLLGSNPLSKKNPDKYIAKQNPQPNQMNPMSPGMVPQTGKVPQLINQIK